MKKSIIDKIKDDISKNKLNIILYLFLIITIIFHIYSIIFLLISIIKIVQIDDKILGETVKEYDSNEKTDFTKMYGRDILRCFKKKSCCIVEKLLNILFMIINMIILVYIYYNYSIGYGIFIYFIITSSKMIISKLLLSYLDRKDIMCPMPSKYNKYMLENDF